VGTCISPLVIVGQHDNVPGWVFAST